MAETNDYLGSHRFYVTLGGAAPADGFTSVSPIISVSEPITFKHGMDSGVRKLPGRIMWEDVTLERVYCGDDAFAQWRDELVNGTATRKDVVIEFQDATGTTKKSYTLLQCFPVRWELPGLDANASNAAIEKIQLCVEGVMAAS